ncbi:hypothetical protein [Kushneria phosphatilytica]|uniref:hypothetical protein n=1 Tax=Kushneria phosphatilytica TaxID=657387 RepID=UPI0011130F94|nr:hypothetical protein [Kushneria phosphatilytica]
MKGGGESYTTKENGLPDKVDRFPVLCPQVEAAARESRGDSGSEYNQSHTESKPKVDCGMQQERLEALVRTLSPARLGPYGAHRENPEQLAGMNLYAWNAQLSSCMLLPLHFCEVTLRNAVSEAIGRVYGPDWPWHSGFEGSLPSKFGGRYKPCLDLRNARESIGAERLTGKVIPELKPVFWLQMLRAKNLGRIWLPSIKTVFPHAPSDQPADEIRESLYDDWKHVKDVRNRIAHHEPILKRNHVEDFDRMCRIVGWRCDHTLQWMLQLERFQEILANHPFPQVNG